MGREIKRVVLDFDWPLGKVWSVFLNPHYEGHCSDCGACNGSGLSRHAKELQDKWYGHVPFSPSETGSEPFSFAHPVIVAKARRNIAGAPSYYSHGELAVATEAVRLAELFNSRWSHHLDSDDVAALLKANRLWDFRGKGCTPTPKEVDEWSISTFGHDSMNCWIVVEEKAKRLGIPYTCDACQGEGSVWDSSENQATAEAWESSEPPTGEGWQMWETVSEGSPVTPVFATAEELVNHLVTVEKYSRLAAERFIDTGWVPSLVVANGVVKANIESLG